MISLIKSALRKNKFVHTTVTGTSMKPLLNSGDKITIIHKNFLEIKLYDLVVADIGNKIVIHQCIFKSAKYLVCRGTNNSFIDIPLVPSQILGIVSLNANWQLVNMFYDSELKKIRQLLPKKTNILVLKGASWQKEIFGYYFNKPTSDIDILIKSKDYTVIAKTLFDLGYQLKGFKSDQDLNYEINNSKINEISFIKLENKIYITIDVHFKAIRSALNPIFTTPISPQDMEKLNKEFWENSYKNKYNLYFLKCEHLLFYLCLHCFFHHGVRDINSLSKIAAIVDKENIDWKLFWNIVKKYRMKNFVYYSLGLSSRFFKIKIPNIKTYQPKKIQRLFVKILINQYTIFRPFTNLGNNIISNKINTHLISFLRLILFF